MKSADALRAMFARPWVRALTLVLIVTAAYTPAFHAGFIWDDNDHLTENPCVIGPLGLKEIWTTSRAIYYPMVLTTFWAAHKIVGLNPVPYHTLNVLMHTASALVLWRVLQRLRLPAPWLGAMFWALHPVMVQSVAWVTELKNTQSCFFYLLSILAFLKADDLRRPGTRKAAWLIVLSLLSFLISITSKPATIMLPVILGLCLYWKNIKITPRDVAVLLPFLFVSCAAAGWTVYEQMYHSGALGSDWSLTWGQRLIVAGYNVWFYLFKIIWPFPLIFIYPRWHVEAFGYLDVLPLVIALLGWGTLFWFRSGKLRPVFFAATYFVLSLFPVLGIFNVYFFKFSFVSDHFQYLASMGPLTLAANALVVWLRSIERPSLLRLTVPFVVLLSLGTLTWAQARIYRDAETLYRTTISRNPASWMAKFNLGMLLLHRNDVEEAVTNIRSALEMRPGDREANQGMARALEAKGDLLDAITYYRKAVAIEPSSEPAEEQLAMAEAKAGDLSDAIAHYRVAVQINPTSGELRYNLAIALYRAGKIDDASLEAHRTLELDATNSDAHVLLGNCFLAKMALDEAISEYSKALERAPNNADVHYNLAHALLQKGLADSAEQHYQDALRFEPTIAEAHLQLGNISLQRKDDEKAANEYEAALKLSPDFGPAESSLAWVLATSSQSFLRNGPRAVALAERASHSAGDQNPTALHALAAAYAESGRFTEAVQTAERALALAQQTGETDLAKALSSELDEYKANLPHRQLR